MAIRGSLGTGDEPELADEGTTTTSNGNVSVATDAGGPVNELPPVVVFDPAAVGPILADTPYTITVGDGPKAARYQLVVDGTSVTDPAAEIPPTSFTPGRHLLRVEITSSSSDTATDPVVVYALDITLNATWRATLSSISVEFDGWAEAVRRFDVLFAAGHTELQLMPSAWIPSLPDGDWNLFVGGFDSSEDAIAYCDLFGLLVPDECFVVYADPDAPAGG